MVEPMRIVAILSGMLVQRITRNTHRIAKDRKSTRLNSSHSQISYAVFCLKKKKKMHTIFIDSSISQYVSFALYVFLLSLHCGISCACSFDLYIRALNPMPTDCSAFYYLN